MENYSNKQLNSELLGYFIEHLNSLGIKNHQTVKNIERDLKRFVEFLDDREIDADLIKAYIEDIERNYMESSFMSKLSSIRQFVEWLNLKENPFWSANKINIKSDYDQFYDYSQIFPEIEDSYNELLISFIYEFYLSVDELINLTVGDYNLASGALRARNGLVEASEGLKAKIKAYLNEDRPRLTSNGTLSLDAPFFVSNKLLSFLGNEEILAEDLEELLQLKTSGISNIEVRKRIALYDLRPLYIKKSRIIHLLDEGKGFDEIELKLSIKIAKNYKPFVKVPEYRLLKAYKDYHPRAHL